jgi:hypothetical protein
MDRRESGAQTMTGGFDMAALLEAPPASNGEEEACDNCAHYEPSGDGFGLCARFRDPDSPLVADGEVSVRGDFYCSEYEEAGDVEAIDGR